MKIFFSFMLLFNIILSNTNTIQSIEITTSDGNIFVGTLIEEDENLYRIVTNSGINIDIPKSIVKEVNYIELFSGEEGLYRPDPNKSMYLFAPSAYPIGDGNSYIRDFQVFFPSYNRGFKKIFQYKLEHLHSHLCLLNMYQLLYLLNTLFLRKMIYNFQLAHFI